MRIGIGYDIHRFNGKGPLRLGGVTVPFSRGLAGYSDGDVLLHAIADALFGAIGAPDLGEQFPSTDQRYRRADSQLFVKAARVRVRQRGWVVGNIDATVIAESPRFGRHKVRMCLRISQLLKIKPGQVSVKAKLTEGFAPGRQGIAAQAVVLLVPARRRASTRRKRRT